MSDTTVPSIPTRPGPCYCRAPLTELQLAQTAWADRQGWDRGDGTLATLGMIEELGEQVSATGFPPGTDYDLVKCFLLMEEVGKYAHATLKRLQGIRGTEAEHRQAAETAFLALRMILSDDVMPDVAAAISNMAEDGLPQDLEAVKDGACDLLIYLLDVANRQDWNLEEALALTCELVFAREWAKFPKNGKTE